MEFLSHPIIALIIILFTLVLFHEFGHFIFGKIFGVGVKVFSIGWGPKLFGFEWRDTEYRVSWLPLGGYVQFAGGIQSEDVEPRYQGKELWRAEPWKRMVIHFAGPFANLILAVFALAVLGMVGVEKISSRIGTVMPESPAAEAGMLDGDRITAINGEPINAFQQLQKWVKPNPGKELTFTVSRDGKTLDLMVVPKTVEGEAINGSKIQEGQIGVKVGMSPPVLGVHSTSALDAGFLAGDRVTRISAGSQSIEPFSSKEIDGFLAGLESAPDSLVFELESLADKKKRVVELKEFGQDGWSSLQALGLGKGDLILAKVDDGYPMLKAGDEFLGINGEEFSDYLDLYQFLLSNREQKVLVSVRREAERLEMKLSLKEVDIQKPTGRETVYRAPFTIVEDSRYPLFVEKYSNPLSALVFGFRSTVEQGFELTKSIAGLFTGQVPLQALGGPILIAKVAGEAVRRGLQSFLFTISFISINLGLINLVPIPVLDGGHMVVTLIEWIRRKPLSEQAMENYHKMGFVMVMALIVIATYNDLGRFWKSMLQGVSGNF